MQMSFKKSLFYKKQQQQQKNNYIPTKETLLETLP